MLKLLLSNPYALGATILLVIASYGAVGYKGYRLGQDNVIAETAKLVSVEVRTRDAAIAAAVEQISKLELKNVYRTDRIIRETVEKPVYRDCVHEPDTLRLLNESLTPPERRGQSAEIVVPGTDPAG